jgi:hypothetical protein
VVVVVIVGSVVKKKKDPERRGFQVNGDGRARARVQVRRGNEQLGGGGSLFWRHCNDKAAMNLSYVEWTDSGWSLSLSALSLSRVQGFVVVLSSPARGMVS